MPTAAGFCVTSGTVRQLSRSSRLSVRRLVCRTIIANSSERHRRPLEVLQRLRLDSCRQLRKRLQPIDDQFHERQNCSVTRMFNLPVRRRLELRIPESSRPVGSRLSRSKAESSRQTSLASPALPNPSNRQVARALLHFCRSVRAVSRQLWKLQSCSLNRPPTFVRWDEHRRPHRLQGRQVAMSTSRRTLRTSKLDGRNSLTSMSDNLAS